MWSGGATAIAANNNVAAATATNQKHDIFVGNLAFNTTEEQLHQVFSEVGRLVKVRMVTDAETGKPRGFAFVEFEDPQAALSAIRNMNDYELNGRRIRVNFSNSSHLEALAGKLGMDLPNTHTSAAAGGATATATAPTTAAGTTGANKGAGAYGTVAVADALKGMSKGELYDVVAKLKEVADRDPDEARRILSGHPQLPEAILFCLSKLDMVQTPLVASATMDVPAPIVAQPPPPPPVADPRLANRPADPRAAATAAPPPPARTDPRQQARVDPRAAASADPRRPAATATNTSIPPPPPPRLDQASAPPPRIDPALAQQVMSLTPEMIAQLPPENRQSILTLRNQITGGR
mmetsp:Transcript_10720/g.16433  ORF Transcript_10720/g.16433 Transcript_10720/m.16433 type:complete len:350 (-) Transcript_10720:209-1258(-)|eukprot:CAMPEP_0178908338 /NCGR_PEP_ID=MMETSP0786-20121207/7868_1 /TAXON_ID=186022 /ORGANISM="Thalassionema frauenfeldii, Strain CCMP 1798" /LENGTH=349 /DNA_ID=CAMNT_0020580231 /DNA_START=165 /DNA_END=1214 /DNA_ORIENTATION=+